MTTITPQPAASAFEIEAFPVSQATERPKTNALAVMSLVFGILQYFFLFIPCWLVTVPFAVNALHQTNRSDVTGRRIAISGLTASATHFAIYAFVFVWLLSTR